MDSQRVDVPPYSFWVGKKGSGPPVVLIHGLGGSSDWWRHNVDALAAHYTVHAVDLFLRPNRLPLQFEEVASLLARWIDSSIGQPVHLVGQSMGGHIAVYLATLRPDLVRSLVLVSSTGVPFRLDPAEHIRNLFFPRGLFGFFVVMLRDAFRAGPTAITLAFGRLLRSDARPLLRALAMPVLLVWGEHDPLVPLPYAKAMLREIPNARLEIVPHASHIAMWENPEVFNRLVLTFFANVSDAERGSPVSIFSWPISGWSGGIAHRQAGPRRDIVLIHGLGMNSSYFVHFARALFDRGKSPIAPDLGGFGESNDAPSSGPLDQAKHLARWADSLGIRGAVWVGHSIGCNAIAHLASLRPDLVKEVICIGPLWSQRSIMRLMFDLLNDAFREPAPLFPFVLRAYWRAGLARWFATLRRYASDLRSAPPANARMVAGRRDPLTDRTAIRDLIEVPGAHACHFSNPDESCDIIIAASR
jgi:pimeloyl-ACP methyl ester carboxylesterase